VRDTFKREKMRWLQKAARARFKGSKKLIPQERTLNSAISYAQMPSSLARWLLEVHGGQETPCHRLKCNFV
jgi:hypothetical protein